MVNPYDDYPIHKRKAARFAEEFGKLGVEVQTVPNNGLAAFVQNGRVQCTLQTDFVLYLDKERILARLLEKAGLRLFNSAAATEICDDKLLTHALLADSGIPMPDTIAGPLCYNPSAPVDEQHIERAIALLGLPMVVKECHGSFGQQVYLCRTRQQLRAKLEQIKCKPYLLQHFEAQSAGRDMRVIVIGGQVFCAMLRSNEADFRANAALSAKCTPTEVPQHIADICRSAASIIGLDYCGVDILLGEEPKLCEVNSNASFEAVEQCTGKNVAEAYARHIVQTVRQGKN